MHFIHARRPTPLFNHQNSEATPNVGAKETSSPYVRVSKAKLTSIITQLLSLLCEDNDEIPSTVSAQKTTMQTKTQTFHSISDAATNLLATLKDSPRRQSSPLLRYPQDLSTRMLVNNKDEQHHTGGSLALPVITPRKESLPLQPGNNDSHYQ